MISMSVHHVVYVSWPHDNIERDSNSRPFILSKCKLSLLICHCMLLSASQDMVVTTQNAMHSDVDSHSLLNKTYFEFLNRFYDNKY